MTTFYKIFYQFKSEDYDSIHETIWMNSARAEKWMKMHSKDVHVESKVEGIFPNAKQKEEKSE